MVNNYDNFISESQSNQTGVIYKIVNAINNKTYIGSTKISTRWSGSAFLI